MGCFSYICPLCKTNIRTGEKCVLIHKRDGKEIGCTRGHYNGYGGVEEDDNFRKANGPNSHEEICFSEFQLNSSFCHGYKKIAPNGKVFNSSWIHSVVREFVAAHTFEQLSRDKVFSAVANQKLENECKKEVEFLVRLCDSLSAPNKNVEDIFTMTLTDRLIMRLEANRDCTNEILKWADGLPQWEEATSGIIAIHDRCYNQNESVQKNLPFSAPDLNQGCGPARKKFV